MKTISGLIEESKIQNLYIPYIDLRGYFECVIEKWFKDFQYFGFLTSYTVTKKIEMCRKCEVLLALLEKFADDVRLCFIPKDKIKDGMIPMCTYDIEARITSAFDAIMKLMEVKVIDTNEIAQTDMKDVDEEVAELKQRFDAVIEKYNKAYLASAEKNTFKAIPCSCEKCGEPECDCCCGCGC